MKITLSLDLSCTLARALDGMRTVTDEGEELYAALEAAAAVLKVAASARPSGPRAQTVEAVVAVYREVGSVKATARETGLARSTVRARLRRAGVQLPANEVPAVKGLPAAPQVRALPGR